MQTTDAEPYNFLILFSWISLRNERVLEIVGFIRRSISMNY